MKFVDFSVQLSVVENHHYEFQSNSAHLMTEIKVRNSSLFNNFLSQSDCVCACVCVFVLLSGDLRLLLCSQ